MASRTTGSSSSFIRPDEFWRDLGLRANQHVVHLGCGAGFYLIPAAKIVGKKGSVTGVDVLSHLLAEAENRARRARVAPIVHTVRANLEIEGSSGLPAASAHWVLVANILHQANPALILAEARRIVKKNGKVVVVDWEPAATPFGPPAARRLSQREALAAAAAQGLTQASQFTPSPYHYGLVLTPAL